MKQKYSYERIRSVLGLAGVAPSYFSVPVILALCGSALETCSVGVFVPIFQGLISGDYGFLREFAPLAFVMDAFPILFDKGAFRIFVVLCVGVGSGMYLKVLFAYFAKVSLTYRCRQLAHRYRVEGLRRCLGYGKQYFDSAQAGHLQTIIDSYSYQLSDQVGGFVQTISTTLPVVFYLAMMTLISWEITVLSIVLLPIFYILIKPISKLFHGLAHEQALAGIRVGRSLHRVLRGVQIVKANGMESEEIAQFEPLSAESADLQFQLSRRSYFLDLTIQLIILTGVGIAAFVLLLYLKTDFVNRISGYVIYLYFLRLTVDSIRSSNRLLYCYEQLLGLGDSILESFNAREQHLIESGPTPFRGVEQKLEVKNLSFGYYENELVLKDVSLTIGKGQVVALVGPSGSGKSTLVQLLMRLYDSPPGTVLVDGKDIREFDLHSLRRRIAYVNQRANLLDDTLKNNITYGCDRLVTDDELFSVIKAARLEEVVEALPFGVETQLGDDGIRLSGGEAQRVSIARALLKDAEFLVLDEATSALDAITERKIQEAIDELVLGRTVVVIAHRFSTLTNADKVVAFKDGRVIEQGSLEELLSKGGLFADLWRQQQLHRQESHL